MGIQLGQIAPDFEQDSTRGRIRFHVWLGNSWGVLFSHPRDYTPVCTTELAEVARLKPEWDRRHVKPIGLTVDLASPILLKCISMRCDRGRAVFLTDYRLYRHESYRATRTVRRLLFVCPRHLGRDLVTLRRLADPMAIRQDVRDNYDVVTRIGSPLAGDAFISLRQCWRENEDSGDKSAAA
jgi:hypothetical protein